MQGELLEPDGTLTVGTHHAETGILSRRSELLELKEQVAQLDTRLADIEQDLLQLRDLGERLDVALAEKQEEIDVLTEQAGDLRNRLQRHRERRQGLHEEVTLNQEEIQRLEAGNRRPGSDLARSPDRAWPRRRPRFSSCMAGCIRPRKLCVNWNWNAKNASEI